MLDNLKRYARATSLALLLCLVATPCTQAQQIVGVSPKLAANANNLVASTSAKNLIDALITTTASVYLFIFNATSAPANGAVSAGLASGNYLDCILVPANATTSIGTPVGAYEYFANGITLVASSTGCSTLTKTTVLFLKARVQ